MCTEPKISIVIPIYKVEKYIEQCARSVFKQSYNNLEIIFVDDATPDDSIELLNSILRNYPNRCVNIIQHSENKGLAMARKTGIDHATGEYIFHVDSDDYLEKNAIELCVCASKNCEHDLVFGNFRHIYSNRTVDFIRREEDSIDDMVCDILVRKQPCNIWGSLIRKSLYENLIIPKYDNGEDFVTLPRLVYRSHSIGFVKEIVYNYTHLNRYSFQFNRLNKKNRQDYKQLCLFLSDFFHEKVQSSDKYRRAVSVMTLNTFSYDLIYSYSLDSLHSLSFPKEISCKEYLHELKWVYRMMIKLYIEKYFLLVLFFNYMFRLLGYKSILK